MKVAVVTTSKEKMDRFNSFLSKGYKIENQDENLQEGRYTNVYTLIEKPDAIRDMFTFLIADTGIDPRKKSKTHKILKTRKAACYLLRNRFDLSYPKIAEIMNYKSPVSTLLICRKMEKIEVKNIPIELAIRRTLDSLCETSS